MGDSERWTEASGLSPEGSHLFSAAFATFRSKSDEWWAKAEFRAAELITSIQPNPASEQRRQAVIDYVAKLIESCFNCQVVKVVKFGSVPLKTYLPDGDIDLTVLSPNPEIKRTWCNDVHNVLQKEIGNNSSEFRVTQVHVVEAEVKIIKIYVEKLLVDVSFDQLGGVRTLCFLEEVDRLIGDDQLFKRSIILVKAWCYYESRLLGANCNLMSTYALETLVLYIFHVFHASQRRPLRGPLEVLYLFLEFFSSFDWDKYCVSLSSPILLASFSEETDRQSIIAEDLQKPALFHRKEGGKLLFTKEFLDACEREYGGGMPVNQIAKPNKFAVKSLNIIDPLRSTNNLGRSVNQGNCARIRKAFALGARTLRRILHASEADVSTELDHFFKNCNLRSGNYQRPDVAVPRSGQTKVSNGVQKIGGPKRDIAKTESNDDTSHSSVSQNGDHLQQANPNHFLPVENTYLDPKEPTVRETPREVLDYGVPEYEGAPILLSNSCASGRGENAIESAGNPKSILGEEVALNSGATKVAFNKACSSNGPISHSRHVDEEPVSIPSQICSLEIVSDRLPVGSGTYEEDELSPGMFSERNGSGHKPRGKLERRGVLVANMGSTEVSKQGTTVNGNHGTQHCTNGSTSFCSRIDSEEEEECSSQSSSKGEAIVSENSTTIVVPECRGSSPLAKKGLLPLPCRPESFKSTRNGSSSLLQDRPLDQHSTPDFAAQTEVQTPSCTKQLVSVGNEEEREFSVPVEVSEQAGNGCEYPGVAEVSQSKVPRRKGRIYQQSGLQSKDFEGCNPVHAKSKRGSGKSKGAWSVDDGKEKVHGRAGIGAQDGGMSQVSSSTAGGSSCPQQSPVPASGHQHVHPPRHSSSDATGGAHFKTSQSRPYPNATGPGSFRHPLANYQFDPGTARMTAGGSGPSHSSPPQYLQSYFPSYTPGYMFPPGFPHFVYSPGMNIHKRNSPAKGDGSSGINSKNRTGQDTNGSIEVPIEISGDSPRNKSQSKASEQITVGIVERLEAEGIMVSTSSKRSQSVAARNTHGANPNGSSSEFLTGDLKLHLKSLDYGQFCEYSCNPSLNQIVYPAYVSGDHAHKQGSWEGPGRPDAALRAQLLAHQFYASGPSWFPPAHQAAYFPYHHQPFWGSRGVELSPRPRGTGTYLPNTQLRQNIRAPGRGQNRGVGQNGSSQQEDKFHQSREHESSHHFHGSHHKAPTNKDEAHAQGVYGSSNRVVENRSVKTERVRDPSHYPKHHDFARASVSDSHPSEPSVSGVRANSGEVPQPSGLLLRSDCPDSSTVPLDVGKSCNDSSGPPIVILTGLSESDVSSDLLSLEFLSSGETLLDGGKRSGPQLKRSASVGHSYDLVKSDDPVAISCLPTTIGELIPTATTQRNGRPTYHMKEEDFPPLGGRRVHRAEITTNGTGSIANEIASNLGRYVSL